MGESHDHRGRTLPEREQFVMDTFIELADTLSNDYDIGEFLQLLVERCDVILEVSTGGVLLEGPNGGLELAAATSEEMKALEEAEMEYGEGPCLEAYRGVTQIMASDLREETDRWPRIAPQAVGIGLIAVFAFPLQLRGDCIGALNLYRDEPSGFEEDDVRLAQAFADVAAIGILQQREVSAAERRAQQLQGALDSRIVIEQAKGILATKLDVSPTDAFERMRGYSRASHEKLRDICRRVVDEGFVPPEA